MLKIKNNVDLKELEKYNFHSIGKRGYAYSLENNWNMSVHIRPNKTIRLITPSNHSLDKLYDLIKADLVEKVGN